MILLFLISKITFVPPIQRNSLYLNIHQPAKFHCGKTCSIGMIDAVAPQSIYGTEYG